jgi:hypothetical protein
MVNRQVWLNFLALLPSTTLTVLTIAVAFLRFYDEQDFQLLQLIANPRDWSNRLTVAALVVALVNFGVVGRSPCVAWNSRNREANRRAKSEEQATRRDRIETERDLALLRFWADSSESTSQNPGFFCRATQDYG